METAELAEHAPGDTWRHLRAACESGWDFTSRWLADGTVYLTLFLSLGGIYLWIALQAERRVGLALITVGALSFGGIVYAVVG